MKTPKPLKLTKKNALTLLFIILVIFLVLYLNDKNKFPKQENVGVKLGLYAPDFESEYLNGTKVSLYELRGKPVILNFWATWCPPCVREMPRLEEFYQKHKNEIILIGINLGEKDSTIERFLQRVNVTFPIVKDKNKTIEKSYNLLIRPSTFFIDKKGIIVDKRLGEISKEELEERSQKMLK